MQTIFIIPYSKNPKGRMIFSEVYIIRIFYFILIGLCELAYFLRFYHKSYNFLLSLIYSFLILYISIHCILMIGGRSHLKLVGMGSGINLNALVL